MNIKNKIFPLRSDLGLQLLAMYILFVVPIVIAALIFDQFAGTRLEEEIKAADLGLARAIAQETNTAMRNALIAVEQLGGYQAVVEKDIEEMHTLFEQTNTARPDINLIYRLDSRGTMVFHYPIGPGSTLDVDFSFREYFQRAMLTTEPLVSLGRVSPTTGQPVATALMPLWENDTDFLGLVATNIKLQSLSNTLESIAAKHRSDSFQVVIIDSAGKVIAHQDSDFLLYDFGYYTPAVAQAVLRGQEGNIILEDDEDEEYLYSYVPVVSPRWGVIVRRPTAVAFATPRSFNQGVLITIGVFLSIGVFFWAFLSRRVIRPLEILARYSQAIGKNEKVTDKEISDLKILSGRTDQMGHMIRSFTRMEKAIQARFIELSTLVQTSGEVLSSLDSQIVLNRILEQVERLLGIKMSAVVQLDEKKGIFKAQAIRGLSKEYSQKLIISPEETSSVTMRAIKEGKPIQISDTETDPNYPGVRQRARDEGYRSLIAIPLFTTHAPPSALVVYSPQPLVFSEREINLLTNFANHGAMAIENATLFERSDAKLQEQTRRLEALIQSMEDGIILEDLRGRILYVNRRMAELSNLTLEEIIGKPVTVLFSHLLNLAEEKEKTKTALEISLKGGSQKAVEIALITPHGKRHLSIKGFTVNDSSGLKIGQGQIIQDITRHHELDRMKSSLISTVSHELRTPLAAIKGYATTLLADDVDWELQAQHEFLNIISLEADRLSDLVTSLLDMSKIEAGNLSLSRKPCYLRDLVKRGVARSFPTQEGRIKIYIPENIPALFIDSQRIEAVIRNLIENAIKYSPEETPIRISAKVDNEYVIIHVEDQGPGIPGNAHKNIFSSFYRLDNSITKNTTGVGLGLAISQGFVLAHGGKIWMEDKKIGTSVAFSLPLDSALKDQLDDEVTSSRSREYEIGK